MNRDAKKRRRQRIAQLNPHQSWQEWRVPPTRNRFIYKCFISLIIYLLIWTIFQLEHSNARRTQQAIKDVMNHSFDYATLTSWYREHIGTLPTMLPAFQAHIAGRTKADFSSPVSGLVAKTDMNRTGVITLHTSENRTVTAIGRGLVQNVIDSGTSGLTVRVLHLNGTIGIYGGLEDVQVVRNDWLEEGIIIGHTNILHFALMKEEQYLNPWDVIPFD